MDATYTLDPRMLGTGLLIARLVLGLIMAAHGAQKLFGWFGGYGLNATGEFFGQLGFAPGNDQTMARDDFVALSRRMLERLEGLRR